MMLLLLGIGYTFAQNKAEIKFDKKGPLVIHQAIASCGCTVPKYTQEPVLPGKTGTVTVTYNGTGRYPGHFRKSITLRTNAETEMIRLYIEGDMEAQKD